MLTFVVAVGVSLPTWAPPIPPGTGSKPNVGGRGAGIVKDAIKQDRRRANDFADQFNTSNRRTVDRLDGTIQKLTDVLDALRAGGVAEDDERVVNVG
jgi:hypothetical protein